MVLYWNDIKETQDWWNGCEDHFNKTLSSKKVKDLKVTKKNLDKHFFRAYDKRDKLIKNLKEKGNVGTFLEFMTICMDKVDENCPQDDDGFVYWNRGQIFSIDFYRGVIREIDDISKAIA